MQITPEALRAVFFSFNAAFQRAFERTQPWYQAIATTVPSTGKENRYPWMEQIPRMREWLGERVVKNVAARSHTIVNKDWEGTIELDRNELEDDSFGLYAPLAEQMGERSRKLPDDVLVQVLQDGDATDCWDGQRFFDTDHPVNLDSSAAGTYSNNLTGTALSAANLQTARKTMMSYLGADGKPLAINPRLLIVPPSLELVALQILNAEFIAPTAATGGNAANVMQTNVLKGKCDLLVIPELESEATTWYLADVSKPIKPFIWQNRKSPVFTQLTDPTTENVFFRRKFIYGVEARGNGGYALPQLCLRAIA